MRHLIKSSFFILMIAMLATSCAEKVKGTLIEGHVENGAEGTEVFLEKLAINKPSTTVITTALNANGDFAMQFPDGAPAGAYNLRIGNTRNTLIFDGTEKKVTYSGDVQGIARYDYEITGSKDSKIIHSLVQDLVSRKIDQKGISTFVDTVSNPELAAFAAYLALGSNKQFIPTHKNALKRLQEIDPNSETAKNYEAFINTVEKTRPAAQDAGGLQVGQEAPDISLKDPNGKVYTLSDLRGKVVLLDFWASWCGPCRRENPNVVKVYNKYKNKGFTVFSVSLDGLDSRSRARIKGDPSAMLESQRKRWVSAIAADKLTWPYHVSDLKKWECEPARVYGVRSIPRAFLIDKEGRIVNTQIRGADMLEEELKKLL